MGQLALIQQRPDPFALDDLGESLSGEALGIKLVACPDALEPWFTCGAHTDDDVARTLEVFEESLTTVLAAPAISR